jgi:hypothetical protein
VKLDDLAEPYASRVRDAKSPGPWEARCISARAAQWVAWNVCEDAWHNATTLSRVCEAIDDLDATTPGLSGPELLIECAGELSRLRKMSDDEQACLPAAGVSHVPTERFPGKYDLAPESDAYRGSARGELDPTLVPGTRLRVIPRGWRFRWVTFEHGGMSVPKAPEDVARTLGLDWEPKLGNLVRVEVPLDVIRGAKADLSIPTLFDVLSPRYRTTPDWRARPEPEHRLGEPWGRARDMKDGGPALPEVIADVTPALKMDAEVLGPVSFDWSTRPFLAGGAPK